MSARIRLSVGVTLGLALGMAGCKPRVPLDEVPVLGGTEEQRAIVREQLAAFEAWVGPDRVSLRSIRFTSQPDPTLGSYHLQGKRISLEQGLKLDELPRVVRHELCHALDFQGDLVPSFAQAEALAEQIEHDGIDLLGDNVVELARREQSEVMALLCEGGPASTLLAQRPCPEDPPEFEPIGRWFAENVWTGEPDLQLDDAWVVEPIDAGHSIPFVPAGLSFLGGEDGQSAQLYVAPARAWEDEPEQLWLDLQTGEPAEEVPYDTSGAYTMPEAPLPVGLTAMPVRPNLLPIHAVVQGERAAVVTDGPLLRFWQLTHRLIFLDEGVWHGVDHCPGETATVFHTPDGLWVGWVEDGQEVRWSPIRPR